MTETLKPTRHRYLVMLMLFVSVVITYLDRSNISITAPAMGKELGFDNVQMADPVGLAGPSFCQIRAAGWWITSGPATSIRDPDPVAAATALLGVIGSFVALFAVRLLISAGSAIPHDQQSGGDQLVSDRERGGAIGFYVSGQFIGLAFYSLCCGWW